MIWDRVSNLTEPGQKVWYILDFWHACDHLGTISKVLYGEGSKQFMAPMSAGAACCTGDAWPP